MIAYGLVDVFWLWMLISLILDAILGDAISLLESIWGIVEAICRLIESWPKAQQVAPYFVAVLLLS